MATLSEEDKKEILIQARAEYDHDLTYRNKRQGDWQTIDDLYYGKKKKSLITRANIHIPKMHGTIETFVSKIDDAPVIDFEAYEEGDKPKAARLTGLVKRDMQKGDWDLKDIIGKKDAALYGRTILKKFSTSENGFTDHLDIVNPLDFLIDPLAGGITPIENAKHLGHDNIIKSAFDLANGKIYDQEVVKQIAKPLTSDMEVDDRFASRLARRQSLKLDNATLVSQDSIRLTEWYTMWKGHWVYCLVSFTHGAAVRITPLKDLFRTENIPFASWAVFPRSDEFWTPGVGELVKEPNIVQNTVLSQMLDNNAYRNYGMIAYDATKVKNPAQLNPKPMGKVSINGNPRDVIMQLQYPTLENAAAVFNIVENIYDKETGITAQTKGTPNSKRMSATEFAGLIEQTADRFLTANKTYKHAMRRVGQLYYEGIEENMKQPARVRILGAGGFEWVQVKPGEIKGQFDIGIGSGLLTEQNKNLQRERFEGYITRNRKNERLNQRFLDEKEAQVFGFEQDEIDRLLNPDMESGWEILAKAAWENEQLLKKDMPPNESATTGHIEKHLDYVRKTDGLSNKVKNRIIAHAEAELEFARRNEELNTNTLIREQAGAGAVEVSEGALQNELNPPAGPPSFATPQGVDQNAFAAALQGQAPAGLTPNTDQQVQSQAIEAAPNPLA